jgi:hypothetical protein
MTRQMVPGYSTLNCKIDKLGPAITRLGRLLAYPEFARLRREQARRVAEARSLRLPEQDDYSLAEIYCSRPLLQPARKNGFENPVAAG